MRSRTVLFPAKPTSGALMCIRNGATFSSRDRRNAFVEPRDPGAPAARLRPPAKNMRLQYVSLTMPRRLGYFDLAAQITKEAPAPRQQREPDAACYLRAIRIAGESSRRGPGHGRRRYHVAGAGERDAGCLYAATAAGQWRARCEPHGGQSGVGLEVHSCRARCGACASEYDTVSAGNRCGSGACAHSVLCARSSHCARSACNAACSAEEAVWRRNRYAGLLPPRSGLRAPIRRTRTTSRSPTA